MNFPDMAIVGIPLFSGLYLFFAFLHHTWPKKPDLGILHLYESTHHKLQTFLSDKRVIDFPGVRLIQSLRSWIAGEIVLLISLITLLAMSRTLLQATVALTVSVAIGAAATFLSLKKQSRSQLASIRSALPVASFLLSLMLEAGMGPSAALREVVTALPENALAGELKEMARSRSLGIYASESFDRSRSRVPLDEYRGFLNLIQQGERLGIGLSQGLRELSSKMLEAQGHRAETLAQKAAVKLLFPLVFFIFPAVFLVILSPVILNLIEILGR